MNQRSRIVLIVDDSPEDRELYGRYLLRDREYSYTFLEATIGRQGLELWQQHQPDVILLDYRLPDLDGLEFLAQLQPSTQHPCLPVIIITGQGNEAIAVQAMKAGAQDYIVKEQITPERLQIAINGTIETVQLRTQLQQRIERERVVAQITQQIHQSLNLDEILQTTVVAVRQFLHTDRVLIVQLKPDGNGTVVAESVGAQWRSLLPSNIDNPCFAWNQPETLSYNPAFLKNYIERYYHGQVTAISNIQDSSIDPCHAELLAPFQVKAHLVVPILQDNQFWGLLIAHHCASTRLWQSLEIDLLKELAIQVSIALRQAELYQQAQQKLKERQQVEAKLRQSEEFKNRILDSSSDCIKVLSLDGRLLYMNTGGLFLMEIDDLNSYLNAEWVCFWKGSDWQQAEQALAAAKIGKVSVFRGYCPTAKNTPKWWEVVVSPILDACGQMERILVISRDITDRKKTELLLQQSEARLKLAYKATRSGLWDWDIIRNSAHVSEEYCHLFGFDPSKKAITYEEWLSCLHPDDRTSANETVNRTIQQQQERYESDFRILHPDGIRWLAAKGQVFYDTVGNAVRMLGNVQDITDRKQVEEELRQSEERYRCLAELIPQLVWTANPEGMLLDVNQRWLEFTGLTLEQAHTNGWKEVVHPEDVLVLVNEWSKAVQQGTSYQAEGRMRRADGVYRWHLHQAIPQKDRQGKIIKWFGSATDIEAQKQLETERDRLFQLEQAARAEAERANRIKDEFLAILSHELRSPLNPILGWTKMLQSRKFNETKTAQALATIERNVKLQTQLIDDLLDVAKILRGKLSLDVAPVNLLFVIESAIDTVNTAAIAKSITLHPILPNIGQVSGDSNRLQQIVWNLLSNAIKFTPKGGRVEIRLKRVDEQAHIIVSDSGKGISPDFLPHIFESFRQEDVSITRKYGGLGLGLAIVRQLVEAHGGMIAAESPGEGLGATFTVQLPLLNIEPEIKQVDELSQPALELTGIRVLTVDDDPDARELLTVLLTEYGATVKTVTSAAEVLANLESFQPDVLVSDIGMPEVDGYKLIQQIRTLPPEKGGKIPAIALTAYARVDDYQRAISSGYQRHVTKPLDPEELVQAVVAILFG